MSGALYWDGGDGILNSDADQIYIHSLKNETFDTNRRYLAIRNGGIALNSALSVFDGLTAKTYNIYGEYNKPFGTYTGNGAASVTINIGGNCNFLLIYGSNRMGIVTYCGGLFGGQIQDNIHYYHSANVYFRSGKLVLNNIADEFNVNGTVYTYQGI